MEAIPVERAAAAAAIEEVALPDTVAPSQAAYARPGLPGERAPLAPRTPERETAEEVRLTPEQEVLAAFIEAEEEPETAAPAPVAEEPAARRERETATGLRFAEEIGDLRLDEDEEGARRGGAPKRGGAKARRPGPAARTRPAVQRPGRRFDLDELDDDEIEAALHGDDFMDDDDEGDDED